MRHALVMVLRQVLNMEQALALAVPAMFSLRAEFALWLSARNCRESPFAVMKRTTLLAVLSAAILFVTAGDAQPLPYSWSADYPALGWAVCGLLLPVLLFCLLWGIFV